MAVRALADLEGKGRPVKRHRRSALETFDGCPYRFDILYNLCRHCGHRHQANPDHCEGEDGQGCFCQRFENIEDRGDESQRGIGFHEVAFRYIDRLAKANTASDRDEASLAFKEGVALSQVPSRLIDQVARLWRPFAEYFELDLDAYFAAEEQQVSAFCLNCSWRGDEGQVTWNGTGSPLDPRLPVCPTCGGPVAASTWIADLVYVRPGEVEIKDWKTYYKGLSEVQARNEFQLKFYLWMALNLWPGFNHYRFTFNFVRLRYEVSVVFTPEEIEAWADEIKGIMLKIYEAQRTGTYPAIPGSHCNLCRLKCPVADNRFRLPVRITGPEERDATASRVLVLEQELRQLKKILKAHCDVEGGFVYGGQLFAHFPEVERWYPAADLIHFLEDRKIDVTDITVSGSGLGNIAHPKKAPQSVLDKLAAVAVERQGWVFRHKRVGDELPKGLTDLLGDDNGEA